MCALNEIVCRCFRKQIREFPISKEIIPVQPTVDFPALCTANTDRLQAKRFLLNDLSSAMSGRPVEVVIEPDLHFKHFGRAQERIDHSVPRFAHIRNLTPAARVDEELFYSHLMQAVQKMLDLLWRRSSGHSDHRYDWISHVCTPFSEFLCRAAAYSPPAHSNSEIRD